MKILRMIYVSAILSISFTFSALSQSGGDFAITQSVVANGGGASSAVSISVEGTIGQAIAGGPASQGSLSLSHGFWTAGPLSATAAEVSVSGRVTTAAGAGIRSVAVTLNAIDGKIGRAHV